MAEVEMIREPKLDDPMRGLDPKATITISSKVKERMTLTEYKIMYFRKSNELDSLKNQITQGKQQLMELEQIQETEELKALKEKLVLAEKLKVRDELKDQLQELEKRQQTLEKEIENLNPTMQKLMQKR